MFFFPMMLYNLAGRNKFSWIAKQLTYLSFSGIYDENGRMYNPKIVRIGLKAHHLVQAVSMDYLVCIFSFVIYTLEIVAKPLFLKFLFAGRTKTCWCRPLIWCSETWIWRSSWSRTCSCCNTGRSCNCMLGVFPWDVHSNFICLSPDFRSLYQVFSTLSFSGSVHFTRMNRVFDVVIIDEAAQAVSFLFFPFPSLSLNSLEFWA